MVLGNPPQRVTAAEPVERNVSLVAKVIDGQG
jgi:hypothetical protein